MLLPMCEPCWYNITSCSGATTGNFRSRIWSMSVKIAVVAPMPRASDRIATVANSGLRRSPRIARRRSDKELVIRCFDGRRAAGVGEIYYGGCDVEQDREPGD